MCRATREEEHAVLTVTAGPSKPKEYERRLEEAEAVFVEHDADEDAGVAAAQGVRDEPGVLERLPRGLQQQTLLGVDGDGLARGDAEEAGVEVGGVVQEAALADIALADALRVRVVQVLQVPAPVGREPGDRVAALVHQPPQLVGRGHTAGEPAAHADDRQGLGVPFRHLPQAGLYAVEFGGRALEVLQQLRFGGHVLVGHDLVGHPQLLFARRGRVRESWARGPWRDHPVSSRCGSLVSR
jgi:hypothetical protein